MYIRAPQVEFAAKFQVPLTANHSSILNLETTSCVFASQIPEAHWFDPFSA